MSGVVEKMIFTKLIRKIFNWKVPTALPSEMFCHEPGELTWEQWRINQKSKYPIRFFICETFPRKINSLLMRLVNFIYWIKCHTIKKYHLLDLRQPNGSYYDYRYGYRDIVDKIIFANFNLLSEYIEKELEGQYKAEEFLAQIKEIEDVSPAQIRSLEKAIELYKWWNNDLPAMQNYYSEVLNTNFRKLGKEEKERLYKRIWEMQCEIDDAINLKLKEIIDIRLTMWT